RTRVTSKTITKRVPEFIRMGPQSRSVHGREGGSLLFPDILYMSLYETWETTAPSMVGHPELRRRRTRGAAACPVEGVVGYACSEMERYPSRVRWRDVIRLSIPNPSHPSRPLKLANFPMFWDPYPSQSIRRNFIHPPSHP